VVDVLVDGAISRLAAQRSEMRSMLADSGGAGLLAPVPHSRAVLRIPLRFASDARVAASLVASILARPMGLPLFVPTMRALAMPAWMRS
jgi:hypothetical protein